MNPQAMAQRLGKWARGTITAAVLASALLPTAQPAQAAAGAPLDIFDPPSTGWASYRNMSPSTFETQFDDLSEDGYRLVDIEVDITSEGERIGAVWQTNADGRGWAALYGLTHEQFSANWTAYRDSGFRLIDQESYVNDGTRYYAGIWVENKENLAWASYRNMTSDDFSTKFDAYSSDFIPVDVEAYAYGGGVRYSAAWVENSDHVGWILRRDMTPEQYGDYFQQYRDTFRVMDIEAYIRNGEQNFAAIWVENTDGRGWYAYRDMTSQDFTNRWNQLWDAGYRLVDYEIYTTPLLQKRYAGVWRQNNDRPDWPLKDEVTALVQAQVDAFDVPGMSVAIAHKDKLVYLRGFGHADVEGGWWAHSRTVYRLASVSKAIAGVLTLLLVDQVPEFDLTDASRTWAPSLPVHHTHTIGQLVSNRSGVGHYEDHGSANQDFDNAQEACQFFVDDPLVYTPGAGYKYSTHAYCLLAMAMEGATGDAIQDILWERLSQPFGLTSLRSEDRSLPNANRSLLYESDNDEADPDFINWKRMGGGEEASAYDLARLGIKLLDGQVLDEAALNTLWTAPDGLSSYALGWGTSTEDGTPVVDKNGAQLGSNTYIRIYPEKEFVIVVLSNRDGGGHNVTQLGQDIGALMLANEELINPPVVVLPGLPVLPLLPGDEDPDLPILELPLPELPDDGFIPLPPDGDDDPSPMPEEDLPLANPQAPKAIFLPLIQE